MNRTVTSNKARAATGWHKHLRKDGKRRANKGTRRTYTRLSFMVEDPS